MHKLTVVAISQGSSHSIRSPLPKCLRKYFLATLTLTKLAMAPETSASIVTVALSLKILVFAEPDLGKRWQYTPLRIQALQIHLQHILHIREH